MAALPTAAGSVRGYVRASLSEWGLSAVSETAELVISELVTNAHHASTNPDGSIRYFGGRVAIIRAGVFSDEAYVHLEVFDQAPGVPFVRDAKAMDESGRGLGMVAMLADGSWGWQEVRGGKVVWARLRALA
jgi:anti-sigma regulatory factor (Ser/Thr protein kinase)